MLEDTVKMLKWAQQYIKETMFKYELGQVWYSTVACGMVWYSRV